MPAAQVAGTRPRRRWTKWLWLLPAALVLALALSLSRTPAALPNAAPTAAQVESAREVYQRVRSAQRAPGVQQIELSWQELATVVSLGGRAAGIERVTLGPAQDRAHLRASVGLPLGFWLNAHAFLSRDERSRPRISARVGRLPLPSFMVHAGIGLARQALRLRGAVLAPLHHMVPEVRIGQHGISAAVDLPDRGRLVNALNALNAGDMESGRVAQHYCRLISLQRAQPDTDFSAQVRRAFAQGQGTIEDNRAIFTALSMLTARFEAGALTQEERQQLLDCGAPRATFRLQGRADLAKHWAVSAALASSLGTDASLSIGTLKEIFDSREGGSGFSLVDLAADRAGAFAARRGTDESHAAALRDWAAGASESDLLPLGALALAEGMSEREFRSRFTDTDSEAYEATLRRIDAVLASRTP